MSRGIKLTSLCLLCCAGVSLATKPLDESRYRLQVLRSSEAWPLEAGLGEKNAFALRLLGYQTVNVVVNKVFREKTEGAKAPARAATVSVSGEVEDEPGSSVELIFVGRAVVGAIRLESGATYLLRSDKPGTYVVDQIESADQAAAHPVDD